MTRSMTTLVLTPGVGGAYFGEILAGLAREIVGADGRLVIVEALAASAPRGMFDDTSDFATRVAWARVDGVVSISTAVSSTYLQQVHQAGKPVVLISAIENPDFPAESAFPDNHGGAFAAVEHLIEHGHTRIGFVGNFANTDIRERFVGYQDAMKAHQLDTDSALVFDAKDNIESGGIAAAHNLLNARSRPTALMVGTDRNAIGLMHTLTQAGMAIPRDLAIVAFDNSAAGAFSTPSLSSVDPFFDEIGALAGRLIVAELRGEVLPSVARIPKPAALTVRESCGCDSNAPTSEAWRRASIPGVLPVDLSKVLQDTLLRELRSGDEIADSRLREDVLTNVRHAMRLVTLGEEATAPQIHDFTTSLKRVSPGSDTIRRFADALMSHAPAMANSDPTRDDGTGTISCRVAAALANLQSRALLREAEATDRSIFEQHVVDAGLLETGNSDPRDLTWLTGTRVAAAALALWEDAPSSGRLRLVGTYDQTADQPDLIGTLLSSETFPPQSLIVRGEIPGREVCVVVPVKNQERDWGLLAMVAEIDQATGRETFQHWAALLCTSLESQRLQEVVRRSALFDSLTGLPNRQLFVRQLEHALALWHRSHTPFAVLFLDVDGFKLINDSLGHQMGDRVIIAVGADITQELRSVDTGARFGGDEFVILLTDTDAAGALVVAQRVQARLAKAHLFDGHEIVTRASIGIATSAIEYASPEDVLHDADTAMYRAKSAEPGTVAFFDAPMHGSALLRASLARELDQGLRENQFELHYQPIVNLTSGCTDRFEALVRWRHPDRGQLLPDEFLPSMEETGLIVQLGHWVITEVCRQLVEWGSEVVNVSINISDKEFWSQDLLTRVLATLERHELAPDRLTLEITESVLMRRPELALRMMKKMHEAGLRLHIDDFGTGYSSLETLHRFPVDAFKIDRSFIRTLTSSDNSIELISALVKLGKALGIAVVAEGVETGEQLAFLQEIGCATGQGYLFMPAVTGDRVADLLGHSLHAEDPVIAN